VKERILHASNGLKISYEGDLGIVENAGSAFNTRFDERRPIPSPTVEGKYYFAYAGPESKGGKRDDKGKPNDKEGFYREDMYGIEFINGNWRKRNNLGDLLNSALHDHILDFSLDGQTMFFYKGLGLHSGKIQTQTFQENSEDYGLAMPVEAMTSSDHANSSVDLWKDDVIIFASNQNGGYGGTDLFISVRTNGQWSKARNLGPAINTVFDETDPFLAEDGMTLYFASNGIKGLGGFDLYSSKFQKGRGWAQSRNLGSPVNGPGNDRAMRITTDGQIAVFQSDRPGGYGGDDIYLLYFKAPAREQLTTSDPMDLKNWAVFKKNIRRKKNKSTTTELSGIEIDELYYKDIEDVLDRAGKKVVDRWIEILKNNAGVQVTIEGHAAKEGPETHNLYFSAKAAQQVKEYMMSKGLSPGRIEVVGLGSKYPMVRPNPTQASTLELKFNRRVRPLFFTEQGAQTKLRITESNIAPHLKADRTRKFIKGLHYKVVVAKTSRMLLNGPLAENTDLVIEMKSDGTALYILEGYQNFITAKLQRTLLKNGGFQDVEILPYIGLSPIARQEIIDKSKDYPDLVNYLSDNNQ